MGEQFTLYRGDDGKPHVVDFRCAHRQTQLSVGWVEDDCIRCRFHGWKYDQLRPVRRAARRERILRRKNSHSQLPDRRISRTDLRLLRRGRAAAAAALSGFRERHSLGGDLYPAVQLRQQFGKRSDPYSVHPSGIGVLYESAAGNSRHHRRGERVGRAFTIALSRAAGFISPNMVCPTSFASESATAIIWPGACLSTTIIMRVFSST